ncbi:hypothetical protein GCM10009623_08220 [Nocardioides aestuarii]|uniref:WXG100 family type VII secretion target n=1 Tax=Nocardioides aestuarii TaxID=252231 RepID=A0ABW4TFX5_9ACTN
MGSDLYIDGEMLSRVRDNFSRIEDLLGGPASQMRSVDGRDAGPSALVSRLNEFGHEWQYGIEQLGEFSSSVVDALDQIARAFESADADLAAALEQASDPEPGGGQ